MGDALKEALTAEEKAKGRKLTKNEKNRLKAKLQKADGGVSTKASVGVGVKGVKSVAPPKEDNKVDYVSENVESTLASAGELGIVDESTMEEFKSVFTKFAQYVST